MFAQWKKGNEWTTGIRGQRNCSDRFHVVFWREDVDLLARVVAIAEALNRCIIVGCDAYTGSEGWWRCLIVKI